MLEYKIGDDLYPRTSQGKRLDFSKDSELHTQTLSRLIDLARDGFNAISPRHGSWEKIDRVHTAYMPLSEDEKVFKERNPEAPAAMVVPIESAICDTFLTYFNNELLGGDFYFPLNPMGPEDTIGTVLLQHDLQQQALRAKMELSFNIQWRDAWKYGLGITVPRWVVERRKPRRGEQGGIVGSLNYDAFDAEPVVAWEGNTLWNVDPYLYIPDPDVPVQRMQEGMFVGFMSIENRLNLLSEERLGDQGLFNCRELEGYRHLQSEFISEAAGRHLREDSASLPGDNPNNLTSETIYCLNLFVYLIPKEWNLGPGEYPEKWHFKVANDCLIIGARPVGLRHDHYPMNICAPTFDGYSIAPISKGEYLYPLQEAADFLVSSYIANIRKGVNGKTIVNQHKVRYDDMLKTGLRYIRLRSHALGMNEPLSNYIHQLQYHDATPRNIEALQIIISLMERISGVNSALQGIYSEDAPERRTKEEVQVTSGNAVARLNHSARMAFVMSMRDMARMLAENTIQYKSQESFVRLQGDWPRILASEYGPEFEQAVMQGNRLLIDPTMLDVDYDIGNFNGSSQTTRPELLSQLYDKMLADPEVAAAFDRVRVFKSIARRAGETNIDSFQLTPQQIAQRQQMQQMNSVEFAPGEEVAERADKGELRKVV